MRLHCRGCGKEWDEEMPQKLDPYLAVLKLVKCPGCGKGPKAKGADGRSLIMMGNAKE